MFLIWTQWSAIADPVPNRPSKESVGGTCNGALEEVLESAVDRIKFLEEITAAFGSPLAAAELEPMAVMRSFKATAPHFVINQAVRNRFASIGPIFAQYLTALYSAIGVDRLTQQVLDEARPGSTISPGREEFMIWAYRGGTPKYTYSGTNVEIPDLQVVGDFLVGLEEHLSLDSGVVLSDWAIERRFGKLLGAPHAHGDGSAESILTVNLKLKSPAGAGIYFLDHLLHEVARVEGSAQVGDLNAFTDPQIHDSPEALARSSNNRRRSRSNYNHRVLQAPDSS